MRYSSNKDISKLVSELVREGWQVERGGKHPKLRSPAGATLIVPSSPSDHRSILNFKRDVRVVREKSH